MENRAYRGRDSPEVVGVLSPEVECGEGSGNQTK